MILNILQKIRFFFHPKRGSYFAFYKILGFFPKNIQLYEEAILHKSSSREIEKGRYKNNERLEFLGDAILDAIIADLVFRQFKTKKEGFLTNTRSKIVQRETLDYVASQLGLHNLIISASNIHTHKSHILGNALEALIGAIYLDKGYEKTRIFIQKKIIRKFIDVEALSKKEVNFKSKLLEWCQKNKVEMNFILLENFPDPEGNLVFQTQVELNGLPAGIGIGFSKKESQQKATHMALKKIKSESEFLQLVYDHKLHTEQEEPAGQEEQIQKETTEKEYFTQTEPEIIAMES